ATSKRTAASSNRTSARSVSGAVRVRHRDSRSETVAYTMTHPLYLRAGTVGQLHETVHVTNLETDLDLRSHREHVPLPQVQNVRDLNRRLARTNGDCAINDRRLIRDADLHARNRTPESGIPVTSETNRRR